MGGPEGWTPSWAASRCPSRRVVVQQPRTLPWTPQAPDPTAAPVAAHRAADGTWEALDAEWDGSTATVPTAQYKAS